MHKKPSKALIKAYKPLVDACILACLSEYPILTINTATVRLRAGSTEVLPEWIGCGRHEKKGGDIRIFLAYRLLDRLHKYGFTEHTYKSIMKSRANGVPLLNKVERLLDVDKYLDYYDGLITNEEN